MSDFYEAVYRVVHEIPRGRVMTYGQIATILGCPRAARAVGYALRASGREKGLPWQRVINGQGSISARSEVERPILQEKLLRKEGILFNAEGKCDLTIYRWEPAEPEQFWFGRSADLPFR